jgi:uncharacterized protein
MVPVQIIKIAYQTSEKRYVVILEDNNYSRFLSISVSSNEAQTLALAIKKDSDSLSVSYDLICDLIKKISGKIKSISIDKDESDLYKSKIIINYGNQSNITLDSKPCDALVLALKMETIILVDKKLLIKKNKVVKNNDNKIFYKDKKSILELNKRLNIAIKKEEYELAANLRDKIILLKS